MALYEFRCISCVNRVLEAYFNPDGDTPDEIKDFNTASMLECENSGAIELLFEQSFPMTTDFSQVKATCPDCDGNNTQKVMSTFAVHYGLTNNEKTAGTTKRRKDVGAYMRDARDIRKREARPGTKDAVSNEIWTGSEVTRGVIEGPQAKK